jgi:hypothetical protein
MNTRIPIGIAVLAAFAVATLSPVSAQTNLDAGKSPAKVYALGCSACHATPHELHDIRIDFLLQHYTTGPEQAAMIANYLEAVRSEPRPHKPHRGPRAETEVADAIITGSIGVAPPAAAPSETLLSETAPSETAPLNAAAHADAVAATAIPTVAPLPAPLDIDE